MDWNGSDPFALNSDFDFAADFSRFEAGDRSVDLSFASGITSELESSTDDIDFSDAVQYINQMLMEEDLETKPCLFHDPLALQAAEKSLYDALGETYPPSRDRFVGSPGDSLYSNVTNLTGSAGSVSVSSSLTSVDPVDCKHAAFQDPCADFFVFQSKSSDESASNDNGSMGGFKVSDLLVPNLMGENDWMLQFKRGLEEGNKFLPKEGASFSSVAKDKAFGVSVKEEADSEHPPMASRERKIHEREDTAFECGRRNKHLAVCTDEAELSELFDKVLLCRKLRDETLDIPDDELYLNPEYIKSSQQGKARVRTQDNNKEVVDLRSLLISCAQSVSANDFRTAHDLLKQIRHHSSPFGDGSQRMAHCFANGLEARMAGTGSEIYISLASKNTSAPEMLKTYQAFLDACPFKKIATIFANRTIIKATRKAEKLHIIDFGISYGFQWPAFIHYLSRRTGGPPKLRITGIELPQRGFRPEERVQETGKRLAKYCERFGVPFEFNAVAKKFENVKIEDFKINQYEVLAVNCLLRFKNLLDETVIVNSPRNAVLNLIRKLKPYIFVHGITNGSYNAPFFVARFKEALFNFSSLFDATDVTLSGDNAARLMFEREFLGREIINVVACEGMERVERPETYKQWHVRTRRAGFRPLRLDPEFTTLVKSMVRKGYHADFTVEEDGNWMLQGWKGRVLFASSAWVMSS